MKKSKRYIKKLTKTPLINKRVMNYIINNSNKGWMPKEKEVIECLEVEIAPDNWIMAVDTNNTRLLFLSINYNIQWKKCPCMKGVRLEDVTPELEEKALNEIKNNN